MNKKIIIGVSLFMLLVIGVTFAWFTWNSDTNTNVSVTIEGINITYEDGEDIKGINLIPVSSKEKGETDGTAIAKEIKVSSTMNAYLNLNMNLETLPAGLKDASFKWELYKGDSLLSSGNFLNNNQGDNINLLSKELVTSTQTTYKLYIWIDGNMSNPNTMQNQAFKFMLNANATDNVSKPSGPTGTIASEKITELLASNPETMNNDDPDGNIRYMGANPNNYVTFNNELWRIIGVFDVKSSEAGTTEKRLKIIKNESLGKMAWDSSNSNNWTTASLNKYLNETYYNTIDPTSQSLIGETYWNIGGTADFTSASNGLASHWYGYERGTTVPSGAPSAWKGKIGLMYPSDYGYATSGGVTTNRDACLATELYGWDNSSYSDCKNNDYLYNSSDDQWTITPNSGNSDNVFSVLHTGYVGNSITNNSDVLLSFASPVLYLNSNVKITGGDGTSGSAFTLGQ